MCGRASIDGLTHPGCYTKYSIDGAFSSISYKGVVKKMLYQFKYKPYLSDLTSVLVDLFYEGLIQNERFYESYNRYKNYTMLVSIPLHLARLRNRGYNHASLLADGLSKKLSLPVLNLLQRTKKTRSQYGLKRKERRENIRNAFILNDDKKILHSVQNDIKVAFLVDDILTTGSTMLEAARALKKAGVQKVWGITLARD